MNNPEIDERIEAARRLVTESEALINHLITSRDMSQTILNQLRINLDDLLRLKAEIVTYPRD